jgi:hypothetical protein
MHPIEICAIAISDFLTNEDFMEFMKVTKYVHDKELKKMRKWRKMYVEIRGNQCLTKRAQKLYKERKKESNTCEQNRLLEAQIVLELGVKKSMTDKTEIIAVVPWIFRNCIKFEICNGHWTAWVNYDELLADKLQKYVHKRKDSLMKQENYNSMAFEKLATLVTDIYNFQSNDQNHYHLELYEDYICKKAKHRSQLTNPMW